MGSDDKLALLEQVKTSSDLVPQRLHQALGQLAGPCPRPWPVLCFSPQSASASFPHVAKAVLPPGPSPSALHTHPLISTSLTSSHALPTAYNAAKGSYLNRRKMDPPVSFLVIILSPSLLHGHTYLLTRRHTSPHYNFAFVTVTLPKLLSLKSAMTPIFLKSNLQSLGPILLGFCKMEIAPNQNLLC